MSDTDPTPRSRTTAVAVGVLIALVAGLFAVGVVFNRVAGKDSSAGVVTPAPSPTATPTPAPTPTPSPTPAPATYPYADCSKATFGPPLAPVNAPADVHKYSAPPPVSIDATKLYQATITTSRGKIVLCLQPQLAPNTVNNFVVLARNHFYDGLKFHRVVADFVIQGGDPTGTGNGGPGYKFDDEPVHNTYDDGAVAMAISGPNTNGSQFFICIGSQCKPLQPQYNLFGKVETGLDVAQKIQQGDVMTTVSVSEEK